jgi:hypothetical protein
MTIWILALVVVVAAVSAGYAQGAIRVLFSLLGIAVGIFLALPLSPLIIPLLPFVAITNTWTQAVMGPIVAFILVGIVFKVVGTFVHRKVEYHFKYRVSDGQRALWERMNRRIGATLGSIGGAIYFVLICLLVSILGYFTIQVGAGESNSTMLRGLTRMAEDVRDTHMDKVVAGMNPAPQSYYELCDFLGFLVQNRDILKRIRTYPPLRALGSEQYLDLDPEKGKGGPFRPVVDNPEYLRMLTSEKDPAVIMEHSTTQEIMTNTQARAFLEGLDLKDLTNYLATGKSAKYADEPILGVWVYNYPASLMMTKAERPDIHASDLIRYEKDMSERFTGASLVATLDNVISIKLPGRIDNTPIPNLTNAPTRVSYTGRWRRNGSTYTLDLHARNGGRVETSPALVVKIPAGQPGAGTDRISFKIDNKTACFDRTPE